MVDGILTVGGVAFFGVALFARVRGTEIERSLFSRSTWRGHIEWRQGR
jgi:hypothetical protein